MRKRMVALAVCAVALTACAADPVAEPDPVDYTVTTTPPVADTPPVGGDAEITLPLSAYLATEADRALVDRAYVALLNRCMETHGFAPRATVPDSKRLPAPLVWRYGVSDPEIAARYGYHLPPEYRTGGNAERIEAERGYRQNPMPDNELRVHQGCTDEVHRELGKPESGGNYLDDLLAQTLGIAGFDQSAADPRVRAATERWADCMRGAGHPAADPVQVGAGFDLTTDRPTPAEVATAEADVTCKQRTNLVGIWYAVEVAYQNSLIQQNIAGLEAGRRSVDLAVRVARRTVGAA